MAVTLHDATVGRFDQTLGAVEGFLEKGRSWCEENDVTLGDVVQTRLRDDMLPFHFQVVSVAHHSLGAVKGVQAGEFEPPPQLDLDYAGLQDLVAQARSGLREYTPDVVNGFEGADVEFKIGGGTLPFVAEGFLLSFSIPNFFFHATTAYDILRHLGAPLGKRDFLGQMLVKG